MKKLLNLALVLGAVAVFALPAVALRAPDELILAGSGETFKHAAHVVLAKNCKECHHMGVGSGSCTDCHGRTNKAPSVEVAFTNCRTCHASATTPAPAASCRDYDDKDSCRADSDCRWKKRRGVCRDRK